MTAAEAMREATGEGRVALFLQGPHGPFFDRLAAMLRRTGAATWRIGFNAGDEAFWRDRAHYIPFHGPPAAWPRACHDLLARLGVSDLVLYGDTRPCHARAIEVARAAGVRVHVFEEGYLRPYWVTYERGGANGNSRLMSTGIDEMRRALAGREDEPAAAPARWGDMRAHMFWGALYHFHVLRGGRRYPGFTPHRGVTVATEFRLQLRRLLTMPARAMERRLAGRRLARGAGPYHLVLMQLAHDASFRAHGPFPSMRAFVEACIAGFAAGAPADHHLVFKAHPLEDGREPLRRIIAAAARARSLGGRVHYLPGGKLAALLDQARSAVTVNSTAGEQALWRGLPLRAFGRAVYARPELVSDEPLASFFAAPRGPDPAAYHVYRRYLLATSQIAGSYYSSAGRRRLLRVILDRMLAAEDPYDAVDRQSEAVVQQLRAVP